jgi:amino acid adenylation domain-containing protein
MVADSGQRVSEVALLDQQARAQLLAGFNRGTPVPASERLLHQRFEQQAAARGDAIAVAFEDEQVTYAELNRRANRLAHYLGSLGVGCGARVALCMERGVEMVVAVLGILKAGAAYVPMDPAYPAERLAYMLGDSTPALLLTDLPADDAARLAPPGVAVAQFAALGPAMALCPEHDPDALALGLQPSDLAYIIYTSGSTGMPKGVMVEHANMARLFDATDPWFSFNEHDVWTLFHSLAFDFSVWELWGALAYGGKLVVVPSWCARSAQDFYALLCAQGVTVLNQTPSAFRQLIQAQAGSDQAHQLRAIVFGGEALELHTLASWIERNDPERTRLVNMYGITEITVHATYRVISAADVEAGLGSVIGVPLPDLQMYILDQHLQPVPVGVAGELHIGGAGVARGYLNRPDLSAARFIDNPFAAGTRLYKTGDVGRWLADGQLEYLGRNDFQVKIRGFRIELGEIEARLARCPGVREAIVIAREDVPGDKRLVAYLIAQGGEQPPVAELRAQLAQGLADYMIPSAFVMLDAYPLTSNGKLDRNALPAPDQSALVRREFEAPQGATESAVASIWQALLGLEQVGRHDNFFELGGHSLMAIGLIERLRQHGLSADVRTVFEAPTLLEMAARLDAAQAGSAFVVPPNLIAPDCTAITPAMLPLVTLTQDEIDRVATTVPGGAANIQDIYPLAPLQEGILFHHLLEGEGDAYLLRSMLRFDTRQRLNTFLAALQAVVARHDILRSAICWHGLSQPVQVVYRSAALPVQEVTLSGDDPLLQLQRQSDPRHLRLDLQRAPLLKAFIGADPASEAWFLSLLNHHMIEDNYSLQLLFGEIQSLLAGDGDQLPPPLPYRNFIAQLGAVSAAEHEAYFRAQLGDVDEPTAPFGLLNVLGGNDAISQARLRLSGADARQLRDGARAHGVTVSTLFHVAYAQVLAKCSGRDDVVFGTVLSGRLQGNAGADQALGLFINTLPLRVSLAGASVRQLVAQTFNGLGRLFEHEQAPLSLAQRCSGVAQGMPLFTALLNYRRMHLAPGSQTLGEGSWEGIESLATEARTNYPIDFSVDDLGDDFSLTVRCAQGADADRVLGYLCMTLNGVADGLARRPEQLLSTLEILPDGEKQRLLVDFNRTDTDFAHEQLIHRQFERQAAAQPGAPAVVYGDHSLTYAELNRLANQLAHRLIALGIVADDRVALCVERSVEMVVGILGILKAGAAYVPLDPAQPADRLAYMLNDCAPRALVTQAHLRADMPALTVPVLAIDRMLDETKDAPPTHNPDPAALGLRATHLAYVIYTSGSTGQAKGVMVEHCSAINFWTVLEQTIYCHCKPNANVALNASFTFDMSLKGLLQLLSGHCVFVIPQEIRADGVALMDFLARHRIDGFDCTPSQLEVLLAAGLTERAVYHPVCVLIGGEAISTQTWNRLRAATAIRFFNMYGPTECTVDATLGDIGLLGELPNIGYPVANSRIYLLDKAMQAVPIGVAGEIHIGGVGLARGYLGKPQLSAERFVPDPFATDPAARLYKTGDLGRWMPDGKIEYLGRNDFQVKLRGFRIELGEIETRLRGCQGVRDAVVVARHDVAGDQRLVAYVLMAAGRTLSIADVREQLLKDLPGYMVPSAFVTLEAFPLNANGKLDRRALPAPDFDALGTRHYDPPQGEVEQAIATMWKEILRLERVGRDDHFFELGGHSLLVVQFITRVRQKFGVDIGINAVFRMPTLAALAGVIAAETVAQFEASDIARIEAEMANMSEEELSAWLEQEERLA